MMKKSLMTIFSLVVIVIGLSACGHKSVSEDLQSHKWTVQFLDKKAVSPTADFSKNDVTFSSLNMSQVYSYSINGNTLSLKSASEGTKKYTIKKSDDSYLLTPKSSSDKDGKLKLVPRKGQ